MSTLTRPASGGLRASGAQTYRGQLETLLVELNGYTNRLRQLDVARRLDEFLRIPDVRQLVRQVPGGAEQLLADVLDEYRRYVPSAASNASSPLALIRILLLQQIDLAWWGSASELQDAQAVEASAELIDLTEMRADGGVRFGFGKGSDRLVRRARDFAVQRLLPSHEPRGPGLPFLRARPEIVSVLNEISDRVASLVPASTPRIWVNSIVRSVEHQIRLRNLGFTAPLPSSHCRGWAADIEMAWFDRFAAGGALRLVLLDYLDSGKLNVIDEGRAWHVCLAPEAAALYGAG
jgi:hypothetical protein